MPGATPKAAGFLIGRPVQRLFSYPFSTPRSVSVGGAIVKNRSSSLSSDMPRKRKPMTDAQGDESAIERQPERLKINGNWKDAVKDALKKRRPPGGWPRTEDRSTREDQGLNE
jgi:hypothetical protein